MQLSASVALTITSGNVTWPGAMVGLNGLAFELPGSILTRACLQAEALDTMPNNVLVLRCASDQEASITANAIASFAQRRPLFINDEARALPALGPICHEKRLIPVLSYACGPGEQIRLPDIKGYRQFLITITFY